MRRRYWKRPDHGYTPSRQEELEVLKAGRAIGEPWCLWCEQQAKTCACAEAHMRELGRDAKKAH